MSSHGAEDEEEECSNEECSNYSEEEDEAGDSIDGDMEREYTEDGGAMNTGTSGKKPRLLPGVASSSS